VAARTTAFAIHGFMAITALFHPADCDLVEAVVRLTTMLQPRRLILAPADVGCKHG